MRKGDCVDKDCESVHCFKCCPPGDWGITSGEWEELRSCEGSEWRDKLRVWDATGRQGPRPGVAHTEVGLDGRWYRVDEHGHIEQESKGCCLM
jgi:hypothetical protein